MKTILLPDFDRREGLITVVTQDYNTGTVLMVAFANKEAFLKTLETGEAHYFSTSRQKIWKKGEESGNIQKVRKVFVDCDGDAIVYKVVQQGQGACHTGKWSCFWRSVIGSALEKVKGGSLLKIILAKVHPDISA